jgi:DNA transformation protein
MSTRQGKPPALRNLGKVSTEWVNAVGIYTRADLEQVGVVETYLRVKAMQPRASLNLLWGLQGALLDIHWSDVPLEMRDELREEVRRAREAGKPEAGSRTTL